MLNLTIINSLRSKIKTLAKLANKGIEENTLIQLENYIQLLLEWNQKINLISRKDEEFIFENHLAPSLAYYLFDFFAKDDHRIIDIGSGGGFPGIVNAICFPQKKLTLVDATKKKITVLTDIIEKLKLKNCNAVWGRCEELSLKKEFNKNFDICTSRGVASLKKLIPLSLPFLHKDALILALKGGDLSMEMDEIKKPSRYHITEYEMDERFYYIERYKTLKVVEIGRAIKEAT